MHLLCAESCVRTARSGTAARPGRSPAAASVHEYNYTTASSIYGYKAVRGDTVSVRDRAIKAQSTASRVRADSLFERPCMYYDDGIHFQLRGAAGRQSSWTAYLSSMSKPTAVGNTHALSHTRLGRSSLGLRGRDSVKEFLTSTGTYGNKQLF